MALTEPPSIQEFDPLRTESNEEFVARLKNMGKSNRSIMKSSFRNLSFDRFNG